jgi:hypothetical protein|tara:strand:- start:23175 stop:23297 length:123 start_codon:yes stop_codon:yes gene_type:complete
MGKGTFTIEHIEKLTATVILAAVLAFKFDVGSIRSCLPII